MADRQKNKSWAETKDLFAGAAFPIIIQIVFSASIIMLILYTAEIGLQIAALVFGEVLIIAAYLAFGRQNGLTAVRRSVQQEAKRRTGTDDFSANAHIGEYVLWKGIVIGLISMAPYILFQLINCIYYNEVCAFILKYAFGWAYYPFNLIGGISEWLNFVWLAVPVGVHVAGYIWGGVSERKKQLKVAEAQNMKHRGRKN